MHAQPSRGAGIGVAHFLECPPGVGGMYRVGVRVEVRVRVRVGGDGILHLLEHSADRGADLSHLISSHLTLPHLTSPHLTSPHLTSPHLSSPCALLQRHPTPSCRCAWLPLRPAAPAPCTLHPGATDGFSLTADLTRTRTRLPSRQRRGI